MTFNSAQFLVQSVVRWADANLQSVFVQHKGENQRGLILLRQDLSNGHARFWIQESDALDQKVFRQRFREDKPADEADAFVERELSRDEDLWVLVLENSEGSLPPVLIPAKSLS